MDWKPTARTAPGPGIEPQISGAQHRGRTTTPPASPKFVCELHPNLTDG